MSGNSVIVNKDSILQSNPPDATAAGDDGLGWSIVGLWLLMVVSALTLPLLPIDETRYVSVAWEMWNAHSQWVPLMNGHPYSDKPPLLFWLIELGWKTMGINALWPRLIAPLASLVGVIKLYRIACNIGFSRQEARLAQLILLSLPLWFSFSQVVMFDVLLSACLLGALEPVTRRGLMNWRRTLISTLWLGAALLAKGPVALMIFLPVTLSAPLWKHTKTHGSCARSGINTRVHTTSFYLHIVVCILLSALILAGWALPAAHMGGATFAHSLLWGQTADRMGGDSAPHARPVWWYLPWMPVLLFPWLLWINQWPLVKWSQWTIRALLHSLEFWWIGVPLVLFSLISGKQIHYLVPVMPAVALMITKQLSTYVIPSTPAFLQRQPPQPPLQPLQPLQPQLQLQLQLQQTSWLGLGRLSLLCLVITVLSLLAMMTRLSTTVLPGFGTLLSFTAAIAFVASAIYWHLSRTQPLRGSLQRLSQQSMHRSSRQSLSLRVPLIAIGMSMIEMLLTHQFMHQYQHRYSIVPLAHALGRLQHDGKTIVYVDGNYQATFQFAGRLTSPLVSTTVRNTLPQYAKTHPDVWFLGNIQDFRSQAYSGQARAYTFEGRTLLLTPAEKTLDNNRPIPHSACPDSHAGSECHCPGALPPPKTLSQSPNS